MPALALLLVCATTEAAIPLNSLQTFETHPDPASWTTRTNPGNATTIISAAAMDVVVQTNDVSTLTNALLSVSVDQVGHVAQWHAVQKHIFTRTAGPGYVSLLATIQNTSDKFPSSVAVAYDFGSPVQSTCEDPGLNGWRAYYSLTGVPNSWVLIPELSTGQTGHLAVVIELIGAWAPSQLLYLLWVDDNGCCCNDGSFSIDNFIVLESVPPPPPPGITPPGTNVLEFQTIRLTAIVTGYGLSYQWFRDSEPLDVGVYPTAKSADLVITNAQLADSGQYHVVVSNVTSSATSAVVAVNVTTDTTAPQMIYFAQVAGSSNAFRLAVTERLCDTPDCTNDATFVFSWEFGEVGGGTTLMESVTPENGTNYICTIPEPFVIDPAKRYYLQPVPDLITDLFGNALSGSITSSPVRIFNTDIADAEIHSQAGADTALGGATSVSVDNDDAGIAQGLLRFNNLFGPSENQIPAGAVIINATLVLNQIDPGSAANFHRMLVDWDQVTVTWNSLINGLTADGVEAVATSDGISVPEPFPNGPMSIDVTPSVQAWADGSPNHGWAILSTGTGGWDFASAESGTPPLLVVTCGALPDTAVPKITFPPSSITVTEGNSFTLTASVTGAVSATYQWTKDNVDIPGANGSSYTAVGVPGPGGNGGNYRLRVSNPNGADTSAPALVTVNPDLTSPVIARATSSADGTTVTLRFSKQLSAAGNYAFDPEVADVTAHFNNGANNGTVTVTSAARTLTTPYRLTVTDTRDNRVSQNLISPNPSVVDLTGVTPVLGWADAGNWNYATNDQAANPNWKTGTLGPEWLVGQQFFGFEPSAAITNGLPIQPNPIRTPLQANDTNVLGVGNSEIFVSAYFVKQVTLPALEANTAFAISHYTDDGAIFYLDGVEIGRYQMPAGPATFTTRSTGGNGEAVLQTLLFFANAGTHHLAVEVHQFGVSSSDVLFGLEINKVTVPSTLVIERNQGTNLVSWSADSAWGLNSSLTVSGNYVPVAGNPLRTFRVPPTAQTTGTFYRLRYAP